SPRPLAVHYTPAVPAGFETLARVRRVRIAARGTVRDPVTLLPVRLGPQPWPTLPARVLGPLRLAWWTRPLDPHSRIVVAPGARRATRPLRLLCQSRGTLRRSGDAPRRSHRAHGVCGPGARELRADARTLGSDAPAPCARAALGAGGGVGSDGRRGQHSGTA